MWRPSGNLDVDVAILGGGPAGLAAALALTHRGYSTVVVERSDYSNTRIGETLPPAVQPLLTTLGIWDQFLEQKHSRAFGIRCAWGQGQLRDNDFIFDPYGSGWHIDRPSFDQMLARSAEAMGAIVHRSAVLVSCVPNDAGNWQLKVRCGERDRSYRAKFLLDATGRSSCFAHMRGARRITWDCLIGVIGFFKSRSRQNLADTFTLIEAVEEGWWYSAVLPNSQLVVAYMTDGDLYAKRQKQLSRYGFQQIQTTKHTQSRIKSYDLVSAPCIVSANSSRLDRVTNGNWLAIGDAAMAFDPLSGQGVYRALESALEAAHSIQEYWMGNDLALIDYAVAVRQDFERYLFLRAAFYSREPRWRNSAFWQRRIFNQRAIERVQSIRTTNRA